MFLVDTLDAKRSGLAGELYQAKVLSKEEHETITSQLTSSVQNEKLLSVLNRKRKDQFDKFLDALDKTGQHHVRNRITAHQWSVFSLNRFIWLEVNYWLNSSNTTKIIT